MPSIQQPMLAQDYDPVLHRKMFPLYGTPKVDGIRCYIDNGIVWARSNKAIPNQWIQKFLPLYLPNGVDAELGIGCFSDKNHFSNTQSVVMSDAADISRLHVYIFDYVEPIGTEIRRYAERITYIQRWWQAARAIKPIDLFGQHRLPATLDYNRLIDQTSILMPVKLSSPEQVELFLARCISQGYEGIVLRSPTGGYEFGRPAAKEGLLLRHKPLIHSEATVLGFKELQHNDNSATTSPTGKQVRSTCIAGKRSGSTLGSFLVRDNSTGTEFSVGGGIGLTQELRKQVWEQKPAFLGRILRYSYLTISSQGKPRMPKFTGFRDERDL